MDRRAATVAQFQVTCEEVGVEVSEEGVADPEGERLGVDQVLPDITLGMTMMAVESASSPSR